MKSLKSNGHNTDPWGTPDETVTKSDLKPPQLRIGFEIILIIKTV